MDRESHQRDLYEAIEQGQYPRWDMYVQIMTEEEAMNMPYNPFDLTKVWYRRTSLLFLLDILNLIGIQNYFAEVEQAAFNPANVVHWNEFLT